MATTTPTKTVDFIPEYSISGDIRKVSEYNFASYNAKLVPIFALITMEKGSNQLYPDMGLREVMTSIAYSEESELETIFALIHNQIVTYAGTEVNVSLDESSDLENTGNAVVNIQIAGVPGPVVANINRAKGFLNIQHPALYKK